MLRELAGGLTLATSPETEVAARRLLAKPRTPPLTPAQSETLAVVAYLAFSSIGSALVYYLTPSELLARGDAAIGETVRLGGQVKAGSISGDPTDLTFVVTDPDAAEGSARRPRDRGGHGPCW